MYSILHVMSSMFVIGTYKGYNDQSNIKNDYAMMLIVVLTHNKNLPIFPVKKQSVGVYF